jgi:streptogramin lyase
MLFRIAVVSVSLLGAVVGSAVLATRGAGESVTRDGVTATLQVPGHPGWLVAGSDALWIALNGDRGHAVGEQPILRIGLGTGFVEQSAKIGGEASFLTRVGDLLVASVRHSAQREFGGRRLMALDWQTGRVLASRAFEGPVDHLVQSRGHLWALEVRPGVLLRLDPRTLAPTATPLPLTPGRALDIASGGGYLWVTAAEAGELLRIDPSTRAITHVHVGGSPAGVAVAGGFVWYADARNGEVVRRDVRDVRARGTTIRVGGKPTWLAVAGGSLFVTDAEEGTVTRIDVRSGATNGLPIRVTPPVRGAGPFPITTARRSVWVSSFESDTVTRVSAAAAPAVTRNLVSSGIDPSEDATAALPRGATVVATVPGLVNPGALAAGEDAVWAFDDSDLTLARIDPRTNTIVQRVKMDTVAETAAGEGSVWVSHPELNAVSRLDPSTMTPTATIRVGREPAGLAVSPGAVWVANIGGPSVTRIDPATNRVVATIRVGPPSACCAEHMTLTATKDAVWVAVPNADTLVRVDPATNTVTDTVEVPSSPCAVVVADHEAVWNASGGCGDEVLSRVDARTRRLTTTVEGEGHPIGLALFDGSLWVGALLAQSIDRVDPETGRIVARLPVDGRPKRLALGFGSVWAELENGGIIRIDPQD